MKTLKQEEIYCSLYRGLDDLNEHLGDFIDNYYNRCRLHSALGCRTPEEFERDTAVPPATAATMKPFTAPESLQRGIPEHQPGAGDAL